MAISLNLSSCPIRSSQWLSISDIRTHHFLYKMDLHVPFSFIPFLGRQKLLRFLDTCTHAHAFLSHFCIVSLSSVSLLFFSFHYNQFLWHDRLSCFSYTPEAHLSSCSVTLDRSGKHSRTLFFICKTELPPGISVTIHVVVSIVHL